VCCDNGAFFLLDAKQLGHDRHVLGAQVLATAVEGRSLPKGQGMSSPVHVVCAVLVAALTTEVGKIRLASTGETAATLFVQFSAPSVPGSCRQAKHPTVQTPSGCVHQLDLWKG